MGIFYKEETKDIEKEIDERLKRQTEEKQVKPEPQDTQTGVVVGKADYKQLRSKADRKAIFDKNRALMFLTVLGIIAIIFLYQVVDMVTPGMGIIMMVIGALAFLPMGLVIGKMLLDPYNRCKLLRRMRGKNYGMAYFVYKGMQRVSIRIKNFDSDIVEVEDETKIWLLEKGCIYSITQDDNKVFHAKIEGDNVVTTPHDIPVVFLDADTMKPLNFHKEQTSSNPKEAGAALLGYIHSKIAIDRYFKRREQFFQTIMLALNAGTLVMVIVLYDALVGI